MPSISQSASLLAPFSLPVFHAFAFNFSHVKASRIFGQAVAQSKCVLALSPLTASARRGLPKMVSSKILTHVYGGPVILT